MPSSPGRVARRPGSSDPVSSAARARMQRGGPEVVTRYRAPRTSADKSTCTTWKTRSSGPPEDRACCDQGIIRQTRSAHSSHHSMCTLLRAHSSNDDGHATACERTISSDGPKHVVVGLTVLCLSDQKQNTPLLCKRFKRDIKKGQHKLLTSFCAQSTRHSSIKFSGRNSTVSRKSNQQSSAIGQ